MMAQEYTFEEDDEYQAEDGYAEWRAVVDGMSGKKRKRENQPIARLLAYPLVGNVETAVVAFAGSVDPEGTKRRGFTTRDLTNIATRTGGTLYTVPGVRDATVLVVRADENRELEYFDHNACFQEITGIPTERVAKKPKLHSTFGRKAQLPYGTHLGKVKSMLNNIAYHTCADTLNLVARAQYHLSGEPTVQGFAERTLRDKHMVAELTLGTTQRAICFQAYEGAQPIGAKLKITLHPGDMYFMNVVAKGNAPVNKPHVRHHATVGTGTDNFLRKITQTRKRKLTQMALKKTLNPFAQAIVDGDEQFTNGNPVHFKSGPLGIKQYISL